MKLDLAEILKQVLPLIQDSHQGNAEKMITDKLENPSLLQQILNLFGANKHLDLATLLPSLLAMVKPENIKDIQDYFTKVTKTKGTKKRTATKTKAKTTAKAKPAATKAKPKSATSAKPKSTTTAKPKPATTAKPKPKK